MASTEETFGEAATRWKATVAAAHHPAKNGIFDLGGASPEALRAVDAALIKAYPHDRRVPGHVLRCTRCGFDGEGQSACRQHPDLLALGVL